MNTISLLKFITSHPLNRNHKIKAITRFVKWQINTRLNPYPVIYPFTARAKLIVRKGMTGATQNLYCGLHEYNDMAFLLHFLREEDSFADIGANIGSYTILAAGHVGSETFAFEPVPSTFTHLMNNIAINRLENKVTAFNIALGSQQGTITFTSTLDTTNHVALENESNTIEVPVQTLDRIYENNKIPALAKIDVEGFETEVLGGGGGKTLKNSKLKAIIIELNGSGKRYGYDDNNIHKTLSDLDFKPCSYNPQKRSLTVMDKFNAEGNTIYVRDFDFVQCRLTSAPKIRILNTEI
ncbi:MAG: FkbM family methyltransferase [Bacteroidales bacterium]|jgi:FkbM family methyltransferase|nr:FkbM family methyltransferase [Bacteroidales bacterium]